MAGPNAINGGDVEPIIRKFEALRTTKTTVGESLRKQDIVVGVFYGTKKTLSTHYKEIQRKGYPVYVGKDFWHRLSGNQKFYSELCKEFIDVAKSTSVDSQKILNDTIASLVESL